MELVILGLILIIWLLWSRVSESRRAIEQEVIALGELDSRLAAAETYISQLRMREAVAPVAAPSPEAPAPAQIPQAPTTIVPAAIAWSAPPVMPAPAPTVAAAAAATPAAFEGEEPSRGAGLQPIPPSWDMQEEAQRWITPAPAGPSLVDRLLVRLGFERPEVGWSLASIQAWLEGRLLAVVGGIALLLGAVFFLSLAFSRGWITEPMRVLFGLVAGAGLMVLGELTFSRLRGILGHVLVAVGLATLSLAFYAATRLYALVPVEYALAGAFLAAVAAAVIAIRHDSQLVAAYGLIAVLAAPPVLGASPNLVTLLFVTTTLIGTTGVALYRTWIWLPPLAFVLAGPQVASYVTGSPPAAEGLAAVIAFWAINLIAAGGEETRRRTNVLRTTTVTLLLANSAFSLWAGFTVLSGDLELWRGAFALGLGIAHLALGLFFLARFGDRHPFGLVVAATGIAALTMAVPVRFGGPPIPIAWVAEAAALAWVATLRRHPYSAAVAALLGIMAVAHLVAFEYPASLMAGGFTRTVPFLGPEGLTFAFILAGLLATGLIVPIGWVRAALAALGGFLAVYVFPFELTGTALVAGWAALSAAGFIGYIRVVAPRIPAGFVETRVPGLALPRWLEAPVAALVGGASLVARPSVWAAGALAGLALLAHLVSFEYPLFSLGEGLGRTTPFAGAEALAFASVLVAIAVVGVLVPVAWARVGLGALAGLLALWVFPFELSGTMLVWAWAALAAAAFVIEALLIQPRVGDAFAGPTEIPVLRLIARPAVRVVGALVGLVLIGHLVAFDFPAADVGERTLSTTPYSGQEGLSLLAALLAFAVVGWVMGLRWLRLGMAGIGLALVVYSLGFEIPRPHVAIAWALAAAASIAVVRRIARLDLLDSPGGSLLQHIAERLPFAAAGLALLFLLDLAVALANPTDFVRGVLGTASLTGTAFADERTYVLGVLALALLGAGAAWGMPAFLLRGGVAAAVAIWWLLPFEVRPGYAVAGWFGLAAGGAWLMRRFPTELTVLGVASIFMAAWSGALALVVVAPPDRLVVDATTRVLGWRLLTDTTVALGSAMLALAWAGRVHRSAPFGRYLVGLAGIVAVYLLSVGVVDWFQWQVDSRPLVDLQWDAQVGLSWLWAILGMLTFATGLVISRTPVRLFGLALLGLAVVKVFVVDLVGLPIEQRVLVLVALGVLLLISSAAYSRLQQPPGPAAPTHP